MDLERIILWLCLFYCLAMTSGVIFLFFKSQSLKTLPSFRIVQYFIVMMYTYGLYALWGNVFFNVAVLPLLSTGDVAISILDFLAALASPFLIIGLIAELMWTFNLISGAKFLRSFALTLLAIVPLLFIIETDWSGVRAAYAWLFLIVGLCSAFLLVLSRGKFLVRKERLVIFGALLLTGVVHFLITSRHTGNTVIELLLIFTFFLIISFIAIYFRYLSKSHVRKIVRDASLPDMFADFVRQFGITKRESEIIQEIYEGKTNQEIADTLFVAVQTVKDHTHRIYRKTQVSNRTQLASLLRSYQPQSNNGVN